MRAQIIRRLRLALTGAANVLLDDFVKNGLAIDKNCPGKGACRIEQYCVESIALDVALALESFSRFKQAFVDLKLSFEKT